MNTYYRKIKHTVGLALFGVLATAGASQAMSVNNVRLFIDGDCGGSSSSTFLISVQGNAGEFPDQDVLVDFGGGVTQYYDAHMWYVMDATNKIIGTTYGNNFSTNTGVYGDSFFSVNMRPSVTGNFTVALQDEADGTADQSLGATYVAGSGQRASTSFNAAALDADCVPSAPADSEQPVVTVPSNITVSTDTGVATAVVTYATVTATDNVGVTSGPTLTAGLASGAAFPLGTTTVTYEASDAAGNTGSASFTVTVEDNEAPVIRSIAPLTLEADPAGTRQIGFSTIVDDNVDTGLVPVFSLNGSVITSPYAFPIGTNVIKINATDTAGNAAPEVEFIFTVTPGTLPDAPVLTTTDINANRSMTIAGTAVADGLVTVTFPDSTSQQVTATGGVFSVTSAANMQGGTVSVTVKDTRGYTSLPATVDLYPDYVQPTVSLSTAAALASGPFEVTASFSEDVTGFDLSHVVVGNGTASALISDTASSYRFTVTPAADGTVTVDVTAAAAQDAASNDSLAATQLSVTSDSTAPTVTLSGPSTPPSGPFEVTASFSEDVTGFDLSHVVVGNGAASALIADTASSYRFTVTPAADGTVTVDVTAAAAQDAASNDSLAATQLSVTSDSTAPTVTLSGPATPPSGPFEVTASFSEDVTGFELSDVLVTAGVSSALIADSGSSYRFTVTPDLGAPVVIDIASGAAEDIAGNLSEAASSFIIDTAAPQTVFAENEEVIREIVQNIAVASTRERLLVREGMMADARGRFIGDRSGRGAESSRGGFNGSATDGSVMMNGYYGLSHGDADGGVRRLMFGEFNISKTSDEITTGTLSGTAAWEKLVFGKTLAGVFLSADVSNANIDATFEGSQLSFGASAGAYAVTELRENLFLDGYLSVGMGTHDLDMSNGILDLSSEYTTRNAEAGVTLSGTVDGKGFQLRPALSASYGYVDLGNIGMTGTAYGLVDDTLVLDAGHVSVGRLSFVPEFIFPLDGLSAELTQTSFALQPKLSCEWVDMGTTEEDCGAGLGLSIMSVDTESGARFNAEYAYEKIGSVETTSVSMKLVFEF